VLVFTQFALRFWSKLSLDLADTFMGEELVKQGLGQPGAEPVAISATGDTIAVDVTANTTAAETAPLAGSMPTTELEESTMDEVEEHTMSEHTESAFLTLGLCLNE
jgi:hypothetical protein